MGGKCILYLIHPFTSILFYNFFLHFKPTSFSRGKSARSLLWKTATHCFCSLRIFRTGFANTWKEPSREKCPSFRPQPAAAADARRCRRSLSCMCETDLNVVWCPAVLRHRHTSLCPRRLSEKNLHAASHTYTSRTGSRSPSACTHTHTGRDEAQPKVKNHGV